MGLLMILIVAFFAVGKAEDYSSPRLVPAIITFGDSAVDVGNNDYIAPTMFKANFPPYGKDFIDHKPTGRFCNGKLATDITAETLGFNTYPLSYLSPAATGKSLLLGANFASAGSGYYDKTAVLYHAIPLTQQVEYYKEYQAKLEKVAGSKQAAAIVKDALHILGTGNGDFVQNYYVNPSLNKHYSTDEFSTMLIGNFTSFVKDLYHLGARRIGVTSLPPLGCLPVIRMLFGFRENGCVSTINADAQGFNRKLNATAMLLQTQLPGLRLAIFDIFTPLYDLVNFPSSHGFSEAKKPCCETKRVAKTSNVLCEPKSPTILCNATEYVFWDGVHPTEAANKFLADSVLFQGISLFG